MMTADSNVRRARERLGEEIIGLHIDPAVAFGCHTAQTLRPAGSENRERSGVIAARSRFK